MALSRRSGRRFEANIWPGFVDAMTALLLVLIFVLTIFMVVQSIQTETITGQESQLDRLSRELDQLAVALGTEQQRSFELEEDLAELGLELQETETNEEFQARLIDTLSTEIERRNNVIAQARTAISDYEAQVAVLLADRATDQQRIGDLEGEVDALDDQRSALELALAAARQEVDAGVEAARLAAARREALEALVADLRRETEDTAAQLELTEAKRAALAENLAETQTALSEEEAARLAEVAAAEALRERLRNSDAELTAMTLSLEAQRKEAEDTLTLLAAAREARDDLEAQLAAALLQGQENVGALDTAEAALEALRAELDRAGESQDDLRDKLAAALAARAVAEAGAEALLSETERQARLLAQARGQITEMEEVSTADQRRLALLNAQLTGLQDELGKLQALLDDAEARDSASQIQLENLGGRLNAALAQAASEARRAEAEALRAAQLEAAERARVEAEKKELENYRSEFFGLLKDLLGDQEGVRVVGDRFVFSSEVLFASGSAVLSTEGRGEIAKIAQLLQDVAAIIPPEINWVIRVDGHTDNIPISGGSYQDNWELSQARALSVVRFMVDAFGFPPQRLAATGFGEYQPVDPRDTPEARARNRRIELKLTER
ncbi:peptidoglycan -binding protein [Meridianimarinicoccus sp. MJW13]|uniref:peptidoglycan -binding protein n=1 Tax=Meridianimarinicoccus sp. MJW13 TaxID=2720031 RepID=UPI001866C479|nr:peptidoglycan -binding protein [Fluviibacterium sp. MJW13]